MARAINKDTFLKKLPDEYQKLLRKDEDFSLVASLWRLDAATIKTLMPSINEKLRPIFDWKFTKPVGKRGKKSVLPYAAEKVKLAGDLMKSKVGQMVTADGGLSGTLQTVQVLAKIEVGGKIKTVSISNVTGLK